MGTTDSSDSIAIVGVGVRCAVGLAGPATAAAVRAGVSGIQQHPWILDKLGEPVVAAYDTQIDADLQGPDRFARLAQWALEEALAPLAGGGEQLLSIDAMLGLPEPRPGLPAGIEPALRDVVAGTAGGERVAFLPRGNAAGLLAMQAGAEQLRLGRCRACVVGGVDSYLSAETLEWMDEEGILKSSANRNGFPPGEAAGFCLMMKAATAHELALPVLGWLEGSGFAQEQSPIRTQTICVGRGLSQAIGSALAPHRLAGELIDSAICDLNGEPYRSEEFALTVLRIQTAFVDATRFVTPADCWGDIGAASGPLFANLAIAAGQRGYAMGPRTLLWASSIGGSRAAIVVRTGALHP